MSRFDDDRARLAAARARQHERDEYVAAEKAVELERKQRGTRELRARFHTAVRLTAHHVAFVTLDAVHAEMSATVIGLTPAHTRKLAEEAGLRVGWDGVLERDANFEAFIRDKKVGGESR
jgi:hypothetical protein